MQKADKSKHLRDLFPELSEKELEEAEENLVAYLEVVMRIYQRIQNDPVAYAEFKKSLAEQKPKKRSRKKRR